MGRILELGIALKINAVAMRGVNDQQLPALAALAMEHPVDVRFIEFMPIGGESIWSDDLFWPGSDILAAARQHWTLVPNEVRRGGALRELSEAAEEYGPARLWKLRDAEGRLSRGSFGLISAVTHDFCRSCNRLRLTAEGALRTCLYDDREYPLRDILRGTPPGERAQTVARVMAEAVAQKPLGSELLARRNGPVASKAMSAIGG
jgi:cyclic pyranopterin phosphate synthase